MMDFSQDEPIWTQELDPFAARADRSEAPIPLPGSVRPRTSSIVDRVAVAEEPSVHHDDVEPVSDDFGGEDENTLPDAVPPFLSAAGEALRRHPEDVTWNERTELDFVRTAIPPMPRESLPIALPEAVLPAQAPFLKELTEIAPAPKCRRKHSRARAKRHVRSASRASAACATSARTSGRAQTRAAAPNASRERTTVFARPKATAPKCPARLQVVRGRPLQAPACAERLFDDVSLIRDGHMPLVPRLEVDRQTRRATGRKRPPPPPPPSFAPPSMPMPAIPAPAPKAGPGWLPRLRSALGLAIVLLAITS